MSASYVARWLVAIAVPHLSRDPPWRRLAGLGLFALGSLLSFFSLFTTVHWLLLALAGAVATGLRVVADLSSNAARVRLLRGVAWAGLAGCYVFWIYLGLAFGSLLGWTVPWWWLALLVSLAAATVWSNRPARPRVGLPLSIPLALLILVSLSGWHREDGTIRCDDYLRAAADPRIEITIPTTTVLAACSAGEEHVVARYPRRVWERPGGETLLVTTQGGIIKPPSLTDEWGGSVCEVPADGSGRPICIGSGKGQMIAEAPSLDRLFVATYGRDDAVHSGSLLALPLSGELRVEGRVLFAGDAGEGFYDPASGTVFLVADEGRVVYPVDAATLDPGPTFPAPLMAGETRYDATTGQGMYCYGASALRTIDGQAFVGVAVRGSPFEYRPLGTSDDYPWAWAGLSWGCDLDVDTGWAYATLPALGLVATLDYDDGRVLATDWIGLGARAATLDRGRGLLYVATFFSGEVVALELGTFRELGRWFVGRFLRQLVLARDGRGLFATSNLGVVRIKLDGLPTPDPSPAACEQIAAAAASGSPIPEHPASLAESLRSELRNLSDCRVVKQDDPALCDGSPPRFRANCLARYRFWHDARRRSPSTTWAEVLAAGLRVDCDNELDEIEGADCDAFERAVAARAPADCPTSPGALHTMCVGVASAEPELCGDAPDCEELARRLGLLEAGGVERVIESGTARDRAHAAAAAGRPAACEPLVRRIAARCRAHLRGASPP